jgi:TRAP-type mannitol/chloroaromatic compound transport system substrate-binding protein
MTGRRKFIVTASGVAAAAGAAALIDAPHVIAQPKVQWRMSTAWPPQLDNLQKAAEQLAKVVGEMSGWAVPGSGLPGRPDHGPVRLFRRDVQRGD